MNRILQDVRYAVRTLRRSPGFTAVAVLTLALGIGANTAIFSVVDGVLLRPLPYPEPDAVMQVWQANEDGGTFSFSHPNFEDVRTRTRSFAALAEYAAWPATVTGTGNAARVGTATVSADFFDVLGVHPARGRGFAAEEQDGRGAPVVLISHGYWQQAFGGAPDVEGRTIEVDERVFTVVGVMPRGFSFPSRTALWRPLELGSPTPSRTGHNWRVIGRLKDGVTLGQAREELSVIARRLKAQYGDDTWMEDAAVVPLHEELVGRVRPALLLLLGAAGLLLLIACANVVNLLLARAASRQRELAVRLALGAGRRRLAQQFLAESLVLSLVGGLVGVLVAIWGVGVLLAFEPGDLPRLDEVRVSWVVLAFALGVSVLAAVLMGIVAAVRGTAGDIRASLAESQRTQGGSASSHRIRGALVASQMALTLVLLVGAGLLARSFLRLLAVDPGYRTEGAVVMDLLLPSPGDEAGRTRLGSFHQQLLTRLRAIPGIAEVGSVSAFPLTGGGPNGTFLILDRPDQVTSIDDWRELGRDESRTGSAEFRVATTGYFRAMGIPLVRGRLFDERDDRSAPTAAAVISESLARTRWPGEDPIGKFIQYGNMDRDLRPFTIIGIVGDVRERGLAAEPRPTFYGNAMQRAASLDGTLEIVIRGAAEPAAVIAAARRTVQALNPDVPVRFRTLEQIFSASLADRRFTLLLLGIYAATALALAAAGIYGVISYLVTQRTREIGIRMALGARAGDVLRLVVRQGGALALIGVLCGLLVAVGLTRLLSGMLYGVGAIDPVTFAGVALGLGGVALFASYIPARRATRVDPMVTLRTE